MYEIERQVRNELADELTEYGRILWQSAALRSNYEQAREIEFEAIGWHRAAEHIRPKGEDV